MGPARGSIGGHSSFCGFPISGGTRKVGARRKRRVGLRSLAGDQPGGEGTGKALGINDDSLGVVLIVVIFAIGFAFNQWQSYQDDDEDFFDTYDSRRVERDAPTSR